MTVISHQYRFVFLRTRKTASTSLYISLSRYAGADGVISRVGDGPKHGVYPRNHLMPLSNVDRSLWWKMPGAFLEDTAKRLRGKQPNRLARIIERFTEHMTAEEIRHALGDDTWDSYYTFAFERNPWDRMHSFYRWRVHRNGEKRPFEEFLEGVQREFERAGEAGPPTRWSNWKIYTIDDRVAVDFLGRYENLNEDLRRLSEEAGIPFDGWIPSAKAGIRADRDYRSAYNAHTRRLIEHMFRREIEHFGYSF